MRRWRDEREMARDQVRKQSEGFTSSAGLLGRLPNLCPVLAPRDPLLAKSATVLYQASSERTADASSESRGDPGPNTLLQFAAADDRGLPGRLKGGSRARLAGRWRPVRDRLGPPWQRLGEGAVSHG
jgi:hypothetical protein